MQSIFGHIYGIENVLISALPQLDETFFVLHFANVLRNLNFNLTGEMKPRATATIMVGGVEYPTDYFWFTYVS